MDLMNTEQILLEEILIIIEAGPTRNFYAGKPWNCADILADWQAH